MVKAVLRATDIKKGVKGGKVRKKQQKVHLCVKLV